MNIDSILFDLDGTLWDCCKEVTTAWNSVLTSGANPRPAVSQQQIRACMGYPLNDIARMLFPDLPKQEREQLMAQCVAAEYAYLREHGGSLYPGVEQVLPELAKRYQLAIVSNCDKGYIECFLEITGFAELFAGHICFGDTNQPKGENIRTMMERLGSSQAVYLGDMYKDGQAAARAGIPFIYACYGFGQGASAPSSWDYAIDNFYQLLDLLANN